MQNALYIKPTVRGRRNPQVSLKLTELTNSSRAGTFLPQGGCTSHKVRRRGLWKEEQREFLTMDLICSFEFQLF